MVRAGLARLWCTPGESICLVTATIVVAVKIMLWEMGGQQGGSSRGSG